MPIVDANGRLFGRFNLFDAIVALFVVALVPLGFGAYLLFKLPAPTLTSIEPTALTIGDNLKVTINGQNLRPYLRVSFDTLQGKSFLFSSTTRAEVELNAMPAGTYDVILYDNRQERARLPKAFTLVEPPKAVMPSQVRLVGRFAGLLPEQAATIKQGLKISAQEEVLAAGKPRPARPKVSESASGASIAAPVLQRLEVPVIVRLNCEVRAPGGSARCFVGDVPVQPQFIVTVPTPAGALPLQIDQVQTEDPVTPVRMIVQFGGAAELLAALKTGDHDQILDDNELASAARVVGVEGVSGTTRRATLSVGAQQTASGWVFQGDPLRAGRAFVFRTPHYELVGTIVEISKE